MQSAQTKLQRLPKTEMRKMSWWPCRVWTTQGLAQKADESSHTENKHVLCCGPSAAQPGRSTGPLPFHSGCRKGALDSRWRNTFRTDKAIMLQLFFRLQNDKHHKNFRPHLQGAWRGFPKGSYRVLDRIFGVERGWQERRGNQ